MWFFSWLVDAINKAVEWMTSLPGLVVTFFASCVTTITGAFSFFSTSSGTVSGYIGNINSAASSVGQYVSQNTVFATLSYMFALDTAWNFITILAGLFLGIFGFLFVSMLESLFLLLAAVMVFKTTRWIASLITLGVSKF